MSLTAKDVQEIMTLLEGSTFDRLALEVDGLKLELERGGTGAPRPARKTEKASRPVTPAPVTAQAPAAAPPPTPVRQNREEGLVEIKSPLLGIFYRAPKPGEPAFVEVGARVEADTVIAIVEVMKLMNSVSAGVSGEIVEIIGTNGELVEHGEALMLVRPDKA